MRVNKTVRVVTFFFDLRIHRKHRKEENKAKVSCGTRLGPMFDSSEKSRDWDGCSGRLDSNARKVNGSIVNIS